MHLHEVQLIKNKQFQGEKWVFVLARKWKVLLQLDFFYKVYRLVGIYSDWSRLVSDWEKSENVISRCWYSILWRMMMSNGHTRMSDSTASYGAFAFAVSLPVSRNLSELGWIWKEIGHFTLDTKGVQTSFYTALVNCIKIKTTSWMD